MSGEPPEERLVPATAATAAQGTQRGGQARRPLSKAEDEARRRLIRQAQAANQAIVKGNCLMVMQMLTGREVLRTHFPWQLFMKHSMWIALQHRREVHGFDEREEPGEVLLNAIEATSEEEEESARSAGAGSRAGPSDESAGD